MKQYERISRHNQSRTEQLKTRDSSWDSKISNILQKLIVKRLDSDFHLENCYSVDEYYENQLCAILRIVSYPLDSTFHLFDRNWDQMSFCITAKVLLTVFVRLTALGAY